MNIYGKKINVSNLEVEQLFDEDQNIQNISNNLQNLEMLDIGQNDQSQNDIASN